MKVPIRQSIEQAIEREFSLLPSEQPAFTVEVPKEASHGDFATNAALMLAKPLRRKPREIAEALQRSLVEGPQIRAVEVAGPGFLNFFLRPQAWQAVLREVLRLGADFGRSQAEPAEHVLVEFVSANPTGPLHFGHGRGAVVGDVLATLLDWTGHRVQREFYVNDAGRQVHNLALSLVWWLCRERGVEPGAFPEDGYRGDYVAELARSLPEELAEFLPAAPSEQQLAALQAWAVDQLLARIRQDLHDFGVRMDHYASEQSLLAGGRLQETFSELQRRGVLEERDGARWFLSERFGDEKSRVLVKSDGSNTYFATDVAYHLDKLRRGHERLIDVWGADHHGYIPRMKAALQALGLPAESLDVVLIQMVSLLRDGQPVVMSKRAGEIVTLREVFEEVGKDAARFFFLLRGPDSQMEFDLELAKRRSLDNPVFYVQYGHARLSNILARAAERGIPVPAVERAGEIDLEPLVLPEELGMIRRLAQFPEVVQRAADGCAPHAVVYFLQELVAGFHSYYTSTGRSDPILGADPRRTAARLILVLALRQVLRNALGLLGVAAPDRMEVLEEGAEEPV